MYQELAPVKEEDYKDLKQRMEIISGADSKQAVNQYALRRALRAFRTVDLAFTVIIKILKPYLKILLREILELIKQ